MKHNDSSSRLPFNPIESAPDFRAPIAVLEALTFAQFPSVQELLAHAAGTAPHPLARLSDMKPPSEPASLFKGLLGGNLDILTQDAAAHPDRYDDQTQAFLDELGAGRKLETLSTEERALLDRAVMDFASFKPVRAESAKKTPAPQSSKPALLREEGELPDERAPQMELPGEGHVRAYWWL